MKSGTGTGHEAISIFSYRTSTATVKNRINLQQNLFSFLIEGEKVVYYAGCSVRVQPGEFLLLSAGNCLMSEKIAAKGGSYRSVLISFDNQVLIDFFIKNPGILQMNETKLDEESVLHFEKDDFLNHFVESLNYMLNAGKITDSMSMIKLHELLLHLGEKYPGQLQKLRGINQDESEGSLIRQAVLANIDHPVSVEELAFLCNTSLSTFKRRFTKIYGTSPSKWFLDKRMQKAAAMLKQGNHKASEIYYELGYENLSSFIQSFKQVYGVTPKQYQLAQ